MKIPVYTKHESLYEYRDAFAHKVKGNLGCVYDKWIVLVPFAINHCTQVYELYSVLTTQIINHDYISAKRLIYMYMMYACNCKVTVYGFSHFV